MNEGPEISDFVADTEVEILDAEIKDSKGYTPERVKAIQLIANRAGALVWMYNRTSRFWKRFNFVCILIGTGMSYLLGTSGIPTILTVESKAASLGIQGGVILVGLWLTIYAALKVDDKIEKNKWAADQNTAVFLDCRREIDRPLKERVKADKFIHKMLQTEFQISTDSPLLPQFMIKKYYKIRGASAIPYEVIFHFEDDEFLAIQDTAQSPRALHWGEADQGVISAFTIPRTTDNSSIIDNATDLSSSTDENNSSVEDDRNVFRRLRNSIMKYIRPTRDVSNAPLASASYQAELVLDQDTPDIRIQDSVIQKMAELDDLCQEAYKPDFDRIAKMHEKLALDGKNPGVRRRRQRELPTSAQRFELEKYFG